MEQNPNVHLPTVTRFYLVREHRLHGVVTGMEGVRVIATLEDNLDRLLISFKDAKVRSYDCHSTSPSHVSADRASRMVYCCTRLGDCVDTHL